MGWKKNLCTGYVSGWKREFGGKAGIHVQNSKRSSDGEF